MTSSRRADALSRLGRALGDPTRCRLLAALLSGPAYPALLARELGLTRSNVSNHLTCLRGAGLVRTTPQGRQVRYEIADPTLAAALDALLDVLDGDRVVEAPAVAPTVRARAPRRPGLAHPSEADRSAAARRHPASRKA